MALTLITEGATSSPTDLNQVVNLLNGTTTNTQVTVQGGVAAGLTGSYARYIGGLGSDFVGPVGQANTGLYSMASGDFAVSPGGPFFVNNGNTFSFPPTTVGETYGYTTVGSGGYVARVHQSASVTASATGQMFPMDTIDYDPRGMVQPFVGGTGLGITIPGSTDPASPTVAIGIACSFRGLGVGSANVAVAIGSYGYSPALLSNVFNQYAVLSAPVFSGGAYTGSSFSFITGAVPGTQLCFSLLGTPSPTFTLDNTDSTRCYIAAWWPN